MLTPPTIHQETCPSPQVPLNVTVTTTGPLINSNQNVFEKLIHLEVYFNLQFNKNSIYYLECHLKKSLIPLRNHKI